jgi:hypothetical protein
MIGVVLTENTYLLAGAQNSRVIDWNGGASILTSMLNLFWVKYIV